MKARLLIIATAGLLGAANQQPAKTDLDKLQGTWLVVSAEGEDGEALATGKNVKFIFKGARMTKTSKKGPVEGTCKLNEGKNPKEIDVMYLGPRKEPFLLRGIYLLDGDNLKMCFSSRSEGLKENETVRPREFKGKGDQILWILKRQRP
jgi:uncharacterized protein (TIGR03067 family)